MSATADSIMEAVRKADVHKLLFHSERRVGKVWLGQSDFSALLKGMEEEVCFYVAINTNAVCAGGFTFSAGEFIPDGSAVLTDRDGNPLTIVRVDGGTDRENR